MLNLCLIYYWHHTTQSIHYLFVALLGRFMEKYYTITYTEELNKGCRLFILPIENNKVNINFSIIPESEIHSISKYKNQIDRNKRLIARSFLFEYCKNYFSINNFRFTFNRYKKPNFLENSIKFSFSYTNSYIAVAIALDRKIGIDIETMAELKNLDTLAQEFMHSNELEMFLRLGAKKRVNLFYRIWTLKEALTKAIGMGLYYAPNKIDSTKIKQSRFNIFNTYYFSLDNMTLTFVFEKC